MPSQSAFISRHQALQGEKKVNSFIARMPFLKNSPPRLFRLTLVLFVSVFSCVTMAPTGQTASGGTGSEIVGNAARDSSALHKVISARTSAASFFIPVVSGNVFCFQRAFVPDTNWASAAALPRARTDSAGGFIIEDAPPGEVMVEVNDGIGNSIVNTISVLQDSTRYSIGTLVVKKSGSISVQAQTQLSGRIRFYVGIKGTHLVARGSQTGIDVRLDNVPTGIVHTVSIRVYEPVVLSLDIPNVTVSPSLNTVLGAFQIK